MRCGRKIAGKKYGGNGQAGGLPDKNGSCIRAEAFPAPPEQGQLPDLRDPALYLNRELSHLEFQRRALEEARDPRNPLLERVKFLSILSSNIDGFFMVSVAGLMQQSENKPEGTDMHVR